jgi:hypothetical protein
MARQGHAAGFRADFARMLSRFMEENGVSSIELARWSGVNRETITDAAQNKRAVRPETIDRIKAAIDTISVRRQDASDPKPRAAGEAMVLSSTMPAYTAVIAACRSGMVVLVDGTSVEVYRIEKVK